MIHLYNVHIAKKCIFFKKSMTISDIPFVQQNAPHDHYHGKLRRRNDEYKHHLVPVHTHRRLADDVYPPPPYDARRFADGSKYDPPPIYRVHQGRTYEGPNLPPRPEHRGQHYSSDSSYRRSKGTNRIEHSSNFNRIYSNAAHRPLINRPI